MKITETPESEAPTRKQTEAIRSYADALGYGDLRVFKKMMRRWGWDYYDVLSEVSP